VQARLLHEVAVVGDHRGRPVPGQGGVDPVLTEHARLPHAGDEPLPDAGGLGVEVHQQVRLGQCGDGGPGTLITSAITQVWASVTMRESKSSACGVSSQVMVTPGLASSNEEMRPVKNSPKSVLRFWVAKRISPSRPEARSISESSRFSSGTSHSTPGAPEPPEPEEPPWSPEPPPRPQPARPAVSTVPVSPAVSVLREMVVAMRGLPVVRL